MNIMNNLRFRPRGGVPAGAEGSRSSCTSSSASLGVSHGDCCLAGCGSSGSTTSGPRRRAGFSRRQGRGELDVPGARTAEGGLVSVTFKVARQSGASGSAVLKMKDSIQALDHVRACRLLIRAFAERISNVMLPSMSRSPSSRRGATALGGQLCRSRHPRLLQQRGLRTVAQFTADVGQGTP